MRMAMMLSKIYKFIYNWAMGVKHGEDAAPIGIYHIQEWE
jgi:hypothetical protein